MDVSNEEWTNIPGGEVAPQTPPQLTGFWIDGVAVPQTPPELLLPPELRPVEQIVLPAPWTHPRLRLRRFWGDGEGSSAGDGAVRDMASGKKICSTALGDVGRNFTKQFSKKETRNKGKFQT